jgi:hypothetical protein
MRGGDVCSVCASAPILFGIIIIIIIVITISSNNNNNGVINSVDAGEREWRGEWSAI